MMVVLDWHKSLLQTANKMHMQAVLKMDPKSSKSQMVWPHAKDSEQVYEN